MRLPLQQLVGLQHLLADKSCLSLPTLTFLGMQSAGKTSFLERLIASPGTIERTIFPVGRGAVTRQPIRVRISRQTKRRPETPPTADEEATSFSISVKGRPLCNPADDLKQLLDKELKGKETKFSRETLTVDVYSNCPSVLPMEVLDLPGLTRASIDSAGDQEAEGLASIALDAVRVEDALIAVFSPSNVDIETSEAFRIARQVDPESRRTIAVVTMCDLVLDRESMQRMDKIFPLGAIYVSAVTSESDSLWPPPFEVARLELASIYLRYAALKLPRAVQYVTVRQEELREEISKHEDVSALLEEPETFLTNVILEFGVKLKGYLFGSGEVLKSLGSGPRLAGGARLQCLLNEELRSVLEALDPIEGLDPLVIQYAIRNASGTRPLLFFPNEAFENLAKHQLSNMLPAPLQRVVRKAVEILADSVNEVMDNILECHLKKAPRLAKLLHEAATELLSSLEGEGRRVMKEMVDIETAYIHCDDVEFVASAKLLSLNAVTQDSRDDKQLAVGPADGALNVFHRQQVVSAFFNRGRSNYLQLIGRGLRWEVYWVQHLLRVYFDTVRRTLANQVPKALIHFLVNSFEGRIVPHLFITVRNHQEPIEELIAQPDCRARERLEEMKAEAAVLVNVQSQLSQLIFTLKVS